MSNIFLIKWKGDLFAFVNMLFVHVKQQVFIGTMAGAYDITDPLGIFTCISKTK